MNGVSVDLPTRGCEFGVRVYEQVDAWPPGTYYWHPFYSFGAVGATTVEQAEAQGWAVIRNPPTIAGRARSLRFTVQHFCSHCRTNGIEPGFKRKKCSQCAGLGVCEIP
jgi:hypothetical protein